MYIDSFYQDKEGEIAIFCDFVKMKEYLGFNVMLVIILYQFNKCDEHVFLGRSWKNSW